MSNLDKRYAIKLDTKKKIYNGIPKFNISDTETSDFYIKITNDYKLVDVNNAIVTMCYIDPSNAIDVDFIDVVANETSVVYCNLKPSQKNKPGTWKARLLITLGEEKIVTDSFTYQVENDEFVILNQEVVEAEKYPILTEMISRLSTIELSESSRQEAESSREEAEKLRQEAIEKVKLDIAKLIKDTNSKVDTNLKENINKVDKLISDTETKIDDYKSEKDAAIQQDLKQYKTDTTQDIDNYKNLKGIEIDKDLEDYKTTTAKNISDYKDLKNAEIDNYKSEKDSQIDNYVTNKDKELDSYKLSKDKEINDFKDTKDVEINNKLKQVEVNETNRVQAETLRQQQHQSREEFLNGFSTRLEQAETKNTAQDTKLSQIENKNIEQDNTLQQVKSDVETLKNKPSVPVEIVQQVNKNTEDNKRQDIMLSGLFNENADGRLSTEENGNDIKLIGSKQGLVEVEKVVGNTLVNRVSEPMRKLTLNGDIDAEGTFVTTNEGADNGLVDVMCEGNTLVNCILKNSNSRFVANGSWVVKQNSIKDCLLKPATKYTLIIYIKENTLNRDGVFELGNTVIQDYIAFKERIQLPNTTSGIYKTILTTKENISECSLSLRNQLAPSCISGVLEYDLVLLEGDYMDKPIPIEYFEGMKSVGEQPDGNHKIEILSNNKNLSPVNTITPQKWSGSDYNHKIADIRLKPNTTYSISNKYIVPTDTRIKLFDYNGKKYVQMFGNEKTKFTTTNSTIYWLAAYDFGQGQPITDIQIEEADEATSFVPHASNKKEILLNEPLRGLPNRVKDKPVKIDGKWYIERNCAELDMGTVNWNLYNLTDEFPDVLGFYVRIDNINTIPFPNNAICNVLPNIKCAFPGVINHNIEGINAHSSYIKGSIYKSKLSELTRKGLNDYFTKMRAKIVYPLLTPIYEPLEITPELLCYNEVTHISNNSLIPSNMKVKNTGFSCRALTSNGVYTVIHDGGEGVTSKVDTIDNMVRLSGKGKKVSDVTVVDGNVSKLHYTFKGMKSSFEDKLVTQEMVDKGLEKAENLGKYKVDITVRGKNKFVAYDELIDVKGISDIYITSANTEGATRVRIRTYDNYGNPLNTECLNSNALYKVKNENSYQLSNNMTKLDFRLSINSSVGYLQLTNQNGTWLEYNNIQIEEGTVATQYEPYKEYNTSVYLNSPLLKGDEIVWKEYGLYHYHKMCRDEITKDKDWKPYNGAKDTVICYYYLPEGAKKEYHATYCNNLPTVDRLVALQEDTCLVVGAGVGACYVLLNKKLLTEYTLEGFKEVIDNLQPNLVYELAEPYYEKISDNKFITETPNNATLHIDSTIPCQSVKVSYTGNVPSVYGLEETGITNTNDIAATQTAVDFLLMSSMGEVMMMSFNENTRGGNNMGAYFASRIMKKALKYEDVIRKYQEFKEDIDFILRSEGYGDLIVEVQ